MTIKRILFGLGAIVLALASVLVVRTLMVPPLAPPATAIVATRLDAARAAAHLAEAVRFRTISWQDGAPADGIAASEAAFVAFREWIAATYPAFSNAAAREIVGDYSLLFTWAGADSSLKPVLLMSHMDVVPVAPGSEADWTHDPFAGDVADGFVWGRGTMDVKNGIVGMLEAAEALAETGFRPARTILFAFGHDEEIGGLAGNKKIAELLAARGVSLAFVNDEGGAISKGLVPGVAAPVALIGVAEKGYVTIELTAKSAGGHSSLPPPFAETAIGRLARALTRLGERPFESRVDGVTADSLARLAPAMPFAQRLVVANLWLFEPLVAAQMGQSPVGAAGLRTTIAPTIVMGGIKENVLPPQATATINFRLHTRDTVESVVAHVRDAVDDDAVDVAVRGGNQQEASPVADVDGPHFAVIRRALHAVVPDAVVTTFLLSGATDSRHYQKLTPNIFRFIPNVVGPGDVKRGHGTDERISIEAMGTIANFYHALMTSLDTLPAETDGRKEKGRLPPSLRFGAPGEAGGPRKEEVPSTDDGAPSIGKREPGFGP